MEYTERVIVGPAQVVKKFPVLIAPPFASEEDMAVAQTFVNDLAESGRTGIVLPDGWRFMWSYDPAFIKENK